MDLDHLVAKYLSMKKINSETIDKIIEDKKESIKCHLDDILDDVNTARNTGDDLLKLAALMDARAIIRLSADYKIYEQEGKQLDFETWLSLNQND